MRREVVEATSIGAPPNLATARCGPRHCICVLFAALDASPLDPVFLETKAVGRKLSPTHVFGYSMDRNTSVISHYCGKRRTGSWPSRHNWQREHVLFQSLIDEVIPA